MGWNRPGLSIYLPSIVRPNLPKHIVRNILFSNSLGIGSRILDVGCGDGQLVRFLRRLGLDAEGFDDGLESVIAAEERLPHVSFYSDVDSLAEVEPFDCILIRQQATYDNSLLSHESLHTTARLMSTLTPGGTVVFLTRLDESSYNFTTPNGHALSCFAQHLAVFPGKCEIEDIPDGIAARNTWKCIVGRVPRSGYLKAQIQIPDERLTWEDWSQIAGSGVRSASESCCRWGLARSSSTLRKAA